MRKRYAAVVFAAVLSLALAGGCGTTASSGEEYQEVLPQGPGLDKTKN